jgi:hypothetical protein
MLDLVLIFILNYILRKNQLLSHMYLLTRLAFGYEGIGYTGSMDQRSWY